MTKKVVGAHPLGRFGPVMASDVTEAGDFVSAAARHWPGCCVSQAHKGSDEVLVGLSLRDGWSVGWSGVK